MTNQDIALLERLCGRLTSGAFTFRQLISEIRFSGGCDISCLSDEHITQLLEGRFTGDWRAPAFAFSEMLAFYSVSSEMSGITVGGWVFTVFVLADVMDHEAADLDYQLKSFAKGFLHAEPHLETHEAAHIFRRFVTGH